MIGDAGTGTPKGGVRLTIIDGLANRPTGWVGLPGNRQGFCTRPKLLPCSCVLDLYVRFECKVHIVRGSSIRARGVSVTLGHNGHGYAGFCDVTTGIFGSQRMIAHRPGICDRQVCSDIAISIALHILAAWYRYAIKQKGDSGGAREAVAADMQDCTGRASRGRANPVASGDAHHWLWPGEKVGGDATTRTQDKDGCQDDKQDLEPLARLRRHR